MPLWEMNTVEEAARECLGAAARHGGEWALYKLPNGKFARGSAKYRLAGATLLLTVKVWHVDGIRTEIKRHFFGGYQRESVQAVQSA